MSEEWQNFETRWDPACWKNIQRHGGKSNRFSALQIYNVYVMYIHKSSTCVCKYPVQINFIIYDFWVHSKFTLLLLLFLEKNLHYLGFFKVAFLSLALHHFSLNFVALVFCSDCHFTIEQQMNPLTASLFFHSYRKWTKLTLTIILLLKPQPSMVNCSHSECLWW